MAVGHVDNDFSMSRGSFKYKKKISNKTWLDLQEISESDFGYILRYSYPKTSEEFLIHVLIKGSDMHIFMLPNKMIDNGVCNCYWISIIADPSEYIYGCGENYSILNLKGENVRIWVAEHQNTLRITKKLIKWKLFGKKPDKILNFSKYETYYSQPTFISSKLFFVHVNTTSYSEFDFRDGNRTVLYLQDLPDLHICFSDNFTGLSKKLSNFLGHQNILPDWLYDGTIIAVQGGTDKIEEKIRISNQYDIKVCGVWSQDWCGCRKTAFGYQVMWNWEWDKELYPNLDQKIKEWNQKGIKFLGYINPFIAVEKDLYKVASERGYCVKNKSGEDYMVTITTFPAAMVDFTNPDAYEWYKNIIKNNMIGLGMAGWMADFGEYLPVDCVLYSGEDPEKMHNTWPSLWAKMNHEAIYETKKESEVFFFTRSGFTDTIKYSSMMWTGDQHVDWSKDDGLPSVIPATLSLSLSGFGITHSDAGGYTTVMQMRRTKELLMRWEEMNVFSPLLRLHEGNQPENNIQFDADSETLTHLSKMSYMHYKLKNYLKYLVKMCSEEGTPVMRPLFYHYNEKQSYEEKTEYLLGRDILVAPIIDESTYERSVYLPNDNWVHLFSKTGYEGGIYKLKSPIGEPLVFIRKNSDYFSELIQITEGRVNE